MENKKRNKFRKRKKVCFFSKYKIDYINYKDVEQLKSYISQDGQIMSRRVSGNCALHQRMVAEAIKRARYMALLPYLLQ